MASINGPEGIACSLLNKSSEKHQITHLDTKNIMEINNEA
jgi:hypothetical protein